MDECYWKTTEKWMPQGKKSAKVHLLKSLPISYEARRQQLMKQTQADQQNAPSLVLWAVCSHLNQAGDEEDVTVHHSLLMRLKSPRFLRIRSCFSFTCRANSSRKVERFYTFPVVLGSANTCRKGACLWPLPWESQEKTEGGCRCVVAWRLL